ncbi:hypothetical protein DK68_99 [Brucella suis]
MEGRTGASRWFGAEINGGDSVTRYGGNKRTSDCHAFPQFNPQHFLP